VVALSIEVGQRVFDDFSGGGIFEQAFAVSGVKPFIEAV